jgi:hypothetical protein
MMKNFLDAAAAAALFAATAAASAQNATCNYFNINAYVIVK